MRLKTLSSIINKIKRNRLKASLENIHDIVGLRIVCLFLDDIEQIQNALSTSFEIISLDDKISNSSYSEFGYMSVHLIAKLKDEYSGPRYDIIRNLKFEIQIRTIAMDAWAAISHHMDYKQDMDIPNHLKKSFHALSGLLHVADLQFKNLHDAKLSFIDKVENEIQTASAKKAQINFDSLTAYLKEQFPTREVDDNMTLSQVVFELGHLGISSLGKLEDLKVKHLQKVLDDEKKNPPSSEYDFEDSSFTQAGMIRMLLSEEFGKSEMVEVMDLSEKSIEW